MENITKDQLKEVIAKHKKWLNDEKGGEKANLSFAYLRKLDFTNSDFPHAILYKTKFKNADLTNAILEKKK